MILYILLGVVLASFVIAFLSAKTWHWGYVILVEAILLATLGFFLLAAETLRINGVLRKQVNQQEKQLDEITAEIAALKDGSQDGAVLGRLAAGEPALQMPENAEAIKSIGQVSHELLMATRRQGRVWRNVVPAGPDPKVPGGISVGVAAPKPPGFTTNSVVYVFEQEIEPPKPAPTADGDQPAPPQPPPRPVQQPGRKLQYLGDFVIAAVNGQNATLVPAHPMLPTDIEMRRLAASRGPWIMYETMPADRYEIFAGMTDEQLKNLLPPKSVEEYLRHGKEATADDDPHRKVGLDENGNQLPPEDIGKAAKVVYQRRLRDYAVELDEIWRRRIAMRAQIEAVTKDIEQLQAAQKSAQQLQTALTAEQQKLTTELAGVRKEREAIQQHLAQVEQLLAKARQLTAEVMAQNRKLADELTARQLGVRPASGGSGAAPKAPGPVALAR